MYKYKNLALPIASYFILNFLAIPVGLLLHYNKVHQANFTNSPTTSSILRVNLRVKCHFHFLDSQVTDSDPPWMKMGFEDKLFFSGHWSTTESFTLKYDSKWVTRKTSFLPFQQPPTYKERSRNFLHWYSCLVSGFYMQEACKSQKRKKKIICPPSPHQGVVHFHFFGMILPVPINDVIIYITNIYWMLRWTTHYLTLSYTMKQVLPLPYPMRQIFFPWEK